MFGFTEENVFVLTVFQLLLSGLILCSVAAMLYLQRSDFVRRILALIAIAFSFYSLHLLVEAWVYYGLLSEPVPPSGFLPWDFVGHGLETLGFLAMSMAYFPQRQQRASEWSSLAALFLVGLLLAMAGGLLAPRGPGARDQVLLAGASLNAIVLTSTALLHLKRKRSAGLFAVAPLAAFSVAQWARIAGQRSHAADWAPITEHVACLLGLGLFALLMDSRSQNLQVRFFLRLNLIFVGLASLLILTVAETERREYLRYEEVHTVELTEYLRGHVLHFYKLGLPARDILAHPDIVHKVTAEFGKLPDLSCVRVSLGGWRMEMARGEDFSVSHSVLPDVPLPARESNHGRVAALTPVPIFYKGTELGVVELDQGLGSIKARVAQQMRTIFLAFTVAVFVAAVLFGITVKRADVTIRRQFEELQQTHAQLAHAESLSAIGKLAGGVAHEINNPAGIILTTTDYLSREAERSSLPQAFREDLDIVRRQARRISSVVTELLSVSRPAVLNWKPTQVNLVVRQSLALLAPRFREERIQVEQRLAGDLPWIRADSDRLEQVFVNLLDNAADAMPRGGRITVESDWANHNGQTEVRVSFADTGAGIPRKHLKSIFDPFFTTKPKGRGTGLGLSVSSGIVREHGGRIEVESTVDVGTVFRVHLPTGGGSHAEL